MLYEIHYSEIGLKGKNRYIFENKLMQNLKLQIKDAKFTKHYGYIIAESNIDITSSLKKVFGIRYFYKGEKIQKDIETLKKKSLEIIKHKNPNNFKIVVNRQDKTFKFTSIEVSKIIANYIEENTNYKGELKNPEYVLKINIHKDSFFIAHERIDALGGLPIGVTGKVLALMSTGIDSPVAILKMMKRGCQPIIYHAICNQKQKLFYDLINKIQEYTPYKIKIITKEITEMQDILARLSAINKENYSCLLFKYIILHDAEKEAKKHNCLGLVTGDNLAQVASQTLENLAAQRKGISIPIYSPLIGMDKEEIIKESKKYELYELSIKSKEDYFFLPKNPIIKSKESEFNKILNFLKLDKN